MVRAKFKCESKLVLESGSQIVLMPVTCGSKENEQFFKYTPSGKIEMGVLNPAAADQFIPGQSYYIDFTPVQSDS